MTTIWFFKRLKSHPKYLMCSDRTVYSQHAPFKPLASHPNRQGVERAQLKAKGRKRVMRSFEYLFRVNFLRPLLAAANQEPDCPF